MGKRYYCDYCERSFADGAENRKKHLASVHHQKLRKAHYDMFKDAATILEEDKMKKPCRKFLYNGECEFGSSCKYSHLTPADTLMLEEQVRMEMAGISGVKRAEPDVDSWIESKVSKLNESHSSVFSVSKPVLPSSLAGIPNLPPSLIPATVFDLYNAQKRNDQEWG